MKKEKFVRGNYWLTKAQYEYIRKVAFKRKISQSSLVREVIEHYKIKETK